MRNDDIETTTDADGWSYRLGARFVTPKDLTDLPMREVGKATGAVMVDSLLYEAFVRAADKQGRIMNFDMPTWWETHVSAALRDEDDEPDWGIRYDRLSFCAIMDTTMRLVYAGFLATRGNGDSVSYRLTLAGSS